jgi:antitoxin component YwqK of YwqJK toxin-antitoxin module
MRRLPFNQIGYRDDGFYCHKDKPFTGVAFVRWDDGKLRAEIEYRDGMRWGVAKEWFPNGCLAGEAGWAWDLYHGVSREWHENGQLASEDVFEYGIRLSGKKWDANGKLVEKFVIRKNAAALRRLAELKKYFSELEQQEQRLVANGKGKSRDRQKPFPGRQQ